MSNEWIQKVICQLATYFADVYQYSVEIHSIYSKEGDATFFTPSDRVTVCHHGIDWRTDNHLRSFWHIFSWVCRLNADILITSHAIYSLPAILAKPFFKGKVIVTEHNAYHVHSKKRLFLNRISYPFADRVVLLTNYDCQYYLDKGVKRAVIIPNAIQISGEITPKLSSHRFISVGRLCKQKGFDMLLDAFAMVHETYPAWILEICGDGEGSDALTEKMDELGLRNNVLFSGKVSNVEKHLGESSVFVLSSRSEGFPLSLLEALSCGLPCVAFDIPPAKEMLMEDTGMLVPANNIKALAEAMCKMAASESLRETYSAKARQQAGNYSLDHICLIWKDLFTELEE